METYYCALAITKVTIKAVLIKDRKVLDRFSINAPGDFAIDELSDFIWQSLHKAKHLANLIFVGCGPGRRWKRLKALLEQRPGLSHLDILCGPDIERLLAMDRMLHDFEAFHQLELLAHISSLRNGEPLEFPGKVLLEWLLNRSNERALRLVDIDRKLQQREHPNRKSENHEQLSF